MQFCCQKILMLERLQSADQLEKRDSSHTIPHWIEDEANHIANSHKHLYVDRLRILDDNQGDRFQTAKSPSN
jgi:hypothetical protein